MKMIQSMRWYGPNDPVSLLDIKQAGCEEVVTALHHVEPGQVWSSEDIEKHRGLIEAVGLKWTVVESLPVHEDIKKRNGNYKAYIESYKSSLINLSKHGIKVVTYNFMPILDWLRTDLSFETPTRARTLRFEKQAFSAFDLFILKRPNAENEYSTDEKERATEYFAALTDTEKEELNNACLQGLPGSMGIFSAGDVLALLDQYKNIDEDQLRNNLVAFIADIIDTAEVNNIKMAIHPDDPPFSVLGLPRIMSTENDAKFLIESVSNPSNGLCFCSGSYGVRAENDLPGMIQRLGSRIYFLHLRSVHREGNGNFHEANHLEGNANMVQLVQEAIKLMRKENRRIPMRPDHGHQMLDDLHKEVYHGYTAIGRLKALAELRGLETGLNALH